MSLFTFPTGNCDLARTVVDGGIVQSRFWFGAAFVGTVLLALSTVGSIQAAESAVGLKPATKDLRELTTDRPDATESPFTVDVGHVQLEMDLVAHSRDREGGDEIRATSVGVVNIRYGVSPRMELGVFVPSWTRQTERSGGGGWSARSGFGDLVARAKFNAWGNDGGPSACGVIVDITLPTADAGLGQDKAQGAVILPLSFDLGGGWGFGAMTGVEFRRDAGASGYRAVVISTATVSREITEKLGAFVELTSEAGDGSHVATCNTGLTFQVDSNLQLDGGVNVGISRFAADAEVFVGLSQRF